MSKSDDSEDSDDSDDDDDDDDDTDYDGNANSVSSEHAAEKSWFGKCLGAILSVLLLL